jgi:sulfate/thiosulfate transport system ATP-binding protein
MSIEIKNLVKKFGEYTALNDVNLSVETGELVALLGPSGCGKTTLLRIIAGIEPLDSGSVLAGGNDVSGMSVQDRRIGFVFQHYALFRHMTVFENVAFGIRVKPRRLRPAKKEIREKVLSLLKLVQLEWAADRYPAQLSGGQRQRVALARALAVEPKILLLDEPFGALDAQVRRELRRWLRRLHNELQITSVFVTHDQEEALEVADRIIVMNAGQIVQAGTPEEIYEHPANLFVYKFLGSVNLFHGRVDDGIGRIGDAAFQPEQHEDIPDADQPFVAYIRPHEIRIDRSKRSDTAIGAVVGHIRAAGPIVSLELERLDNRQVVYAEMSRERYLKLELKRGERVFLEIDNIRVFAEEEEEEQPEYFI